MYRTEIVPFWRTGEVVPRNGEGFTSLWSEMSHLLSEGLDVNTGESDVRSFQPSLDVRENEKEFRIDIEVPGLNENEIDVSVDDGILTLKAEKKVEKKEKNENYWRTERRFGKFERSITLPPGTYSIAVRQDPPLPSYSFWNIAIRVDSVSMPVPVIGPIGRVLLLGGLLGLAVWKQASRPPNKPMRSDAE